MTSIAHQVRLAAVERRLDEYEHRVADLERLVAAIPAAPAGRTANGRTAVIKALAVQPMTRAAVATCAWCPSSFKPRPAGGSPQRFCSTRCRQRFHTAARRWAIVAIEAGVLTADDLRNGFVSACTLPGAPLS
jgi:hypothetical protein